MAPKARTCLPNDVGVKLPILLIINLHSCFARLEKCIFLKAKQSARQTKPMC